MKSTIVASCLIMLIAPATLLAQDTGVRDTVRFIPSFTDWHVFSDADSIFSVELWAYTDQNVQSIVLGFRIETSTGGGTGRDDSLVLVDTFDFDLDAPIFVVEQISALDTSLIPHGTNTGFNGVVLGAIAFMGSVIPPGTHTKIGDLRIKLVEPALMSQFFEISIDSSFFFPNEFEFASPGGVGRYVPEFIGCTIAVDNHLGVDDALCGDVNNSGDVDVDDIVYLINYIFGGGPPSVVMHTADTNCQDGIDVDDAIYLVNYAFLGGPTPCDPDENNVPDC